MLDTAVVIAISLAYLGILFGVAFYGDRRAQTGRSLTRMSAPTSLRVPDRCDRLRLELTATLGNRDPWRLADLGFEPQDARYWGGLPSDAELYQPDPDYSEIKELRAQLWREASAPRFPLTGDGLRFAVEGAEIAAAVALDALACGRPDAARELGRRRAATFAGKWRFNRALRSLIERPGAVTAAARGAALVPALVRSLVAIAGDCGKAALDSKEPL